MVEKLLNTFQKPRHLLHWLFKVNGHAEKNGTPLQLPVDRVILTPEDEQIIRALVSKLPIFDEWSAEMLRAEGLRLKNAIESILKEGSPPPYLQISSHLPEASDGACDFCGERFPSESYFFKSTITLDGIRISREDLHHFTHQSETGGKFPYQKSQITTLARILPAATL